MTACWRRRTSDVIAEVRVAASERRLHHGTVRVEALCGCDHGYTSAYTRASVTYFLVAHALKEPSGIYGCSLRNLCFLVEFQIPLRLAQRAFRDHLPLVRVGFAASSFSIDKPACSCPISLLLRDGGNSFDRDLLALPRTPGDPIVRWFSFAGVFVSCYLDAILAAVTLPKSPM